MYILAFETSCDDTSIAIFQDNILLGMDTKSQVKIHNITQGVVPEVAAREHANHIFDVLASVLEQAKITLSDIDYIAVTTHPGLIPSLLTGVTVAGTLSTFLKKPILGIHHIEAHIFSNWLERNAQDISFPLLCLTASGGHTEIYLKNSLDHMEKLGGTQDDAAGEAYDKVAKMMGLGYPGGPIISQLASKWIEKKGDFGKSQGLFPRVYLEKSEVEFSFSGLKSAVKREIELRSISGNLAEDDMQEIAFEFQASVNEVLAYKLIDAAKKQGISTVLLAGGVSANEDLRTRVLELASREKIQVFFPVKKLYCMDNAAMIGMTAYYKILQEAPTHIGTLIL